MKILLFNSNNIAFKTKDDLSRVIPVCMNGKVLNFGQGEGQVEIENTVWGFYVYSNSSYYMAYEEGSIDWGQLKALIDAILSQLKKEFGSSIEFIAEGPFTNKPNT
jgi:hypothetical protein